MRDIPVDSEITLRPLEPQHAVELFALIEANRPRLRQWFPWVDGSREVRDTLRFIDVAQQQRRTRRAFETAIFYQGHIVGASGMPTLDWSNRVAEIGYWLDYLYEGRGIVTRSCRALTAFAFTEFGMNRVQIRCAVQNTRSRAVPQRLGFREEGVLRESQWLYNHFVDLVIYSMLAREWQA